MLKKRIANPKGMTIVELIIAGTVATIFLLGTAVALIDSHRGWQRMYDQIYSDVVTDGNVARRMFDRFVRKASAKDILLDETGLWVEVHYYRDWASAELDRYAYFYLSGNELKVEHGIWNPGDIDPKAPLSTQTVCCDVSSCVFMRQGASVQMVLKLDNGSETAMVMSSAVTHN